MQESDLKSNENTDKSSQSAEINLNGIMRKYLASPNLQQVLNKYSFLKNSFPEIKFA